MATVRAVTRKNGTVAHQVRWREDGRETSETFDDPHEANRLKRFLDANRNRYALAEKAANAASATGPTVAEVMDLHLETLSGVESRTPADYRRIIRLHINPTLGARHVDELTRRDIARWVNTLTAEGASPKSIANWHGLLSSAMSTAVDEGIITGSPCRGVRLPRKRKVMDEDRLIELEEWRELMDELRPSWHLLFRTLAGSGVRWSEARALRRRSLRGGELRIREAWKHDPARGWYIGLPKSDAGIRNIPLDDDLAEDLNRAGHGLAPDDWLLRGPRGGLIDYPTVHADVWTPAVRRALDAGGLVLPHQMRDIRHSHGSWLVEAGVDLMAVQKRMGHESITTTINVYGHASSKGRQAPAVVMGRLLPRPE